MIEFVCDSCRRVKDPDEIWILGLAAEAVLGLQSLLDQIAQLVIRDGSARLDLQLVVDVGDTGHVARRDFRPPSLLPRGNVAAEHHLALRDTD